MTPETETIIVGNIAKIEHILARIAHALEVMAKHSNPEFKALSETASDTVPASRTANPPRL
jgi:hypothetical protein